MRKPGMPTKGREYASIAFSRVIILKELLEVLVRVFASNICN
jgi:hypothetical protein